MTALVIAMVALVAMTGLIVYVYEQSLRRLAAECDQLCEENEKLKSALFPQLRNFSVAGSTPDASPVKRSSTAGPSDGSASVLSSLLAARMPSRLKFKMLSRQSNTKQKGRDRTAAAIKEQTSHA